MINPILALIGAQLLSDDEAYALTLAHAKLQQEFPGTELPRKWLVLAMFCVVVGRIGIVRFRSANVQRAATRTEAARASPFVFRAPGTAPQAPPPDAGPLGARDPAPAAGELVRRAGTAGGEMIIPTAPPDGGTIKFN